MPTTDPRPDSAFAGSDVARLQRTATDVQQELLELTGQIHDAEVSLRAATDAAAKARAERVAADQVVAAQQGEVDLDQRNVDAGNRAAAVSSELQGLWLTPMRRLSLSSGRSGNGTRPRLRTGGPISGGWPASRCRQSVSYVILVTFLLG
jgi:hypothetical protein